MPTRLLLLMFSLATLLAQTNHIYAQKEKSPLVFKAIIVDASNQSPIPFANAKQLNSSGGAVADEYGYVELSAKSGPIEIQASALGFLTIDFTLSTPDSTYQIALEPNNDLPVIMVDGKPKEVTVERNHVTNYRVAFITTWQDEIIVTYRRGLSQDHQLKRYNKDGELLETLAIKIKGLSGVTTRCSERLYLLTGTEAIVLDRVDGSMAAVEKLSRHDYNILFAGCQMKRKDHYVFEQNFYNGLMRRSSIQPTGQDPIHFQMYRNPVVKNYFRDRYLMAYYDASGAIENSNGNFNQRLRGRQFFADFLKNILYNDSAQNYYFLDRGQLLCFNFAARRMRTFSWQGELLDELSIPEKSGKLDFHDRVIQDPVTGRYYSWSKQQDEHILFEIHPNYTAKTAMDIPEVLTNEVAILPLILVEDIHVLNGQIYAKGKSNLDHRSLGPTLYKADLRKSLAANN